mgnify:CR=1 FL=1
MSDTATAKVAPIQAPRWGFWMTCVWMGGYFVALSLIAWVLVVAYMMVSGIPVTRAEIALLRENTDFLASISMYAEVIGLPLILLMITSKKGSVWKDYLPYRAVAVGRVILWLILCYFALFIAGDIGQRLGLPRSDFMEQVGATQTPWSMIISVVLVAPIVEEMLFRGFMYAGFERSIGALPAVLLSSLIFTAIHSQYQWAELLVVLVLGLVLGLARMRTQSLITPTVIHMVNNGLSMWVVMSQAAGPIS